MIRGLTDPARIRWDKTPDSARVYGAFSVSASRDKEAKHLKLGL